MTALEVGVLSQAKRNKNLTIKFNLEVAKESIQQKTIDYDGAGDTHYDLASALQKSMRGSDPDATIYWLARMLSGGEDIRFIARRIAICATEDVGNADPMAAGFSRGGGSDYLNLSVCLKRNWLWRRRLFMLHVLQNQMRRVLLYGRPCLM